MPITMTKNNINNTNISFTQKIMNKYNSTSLPRILFSTAPSETTESNNTSNNHNHKPHQNYNHNNEGDFDDLSTIKTSPDDEHLLKKKNCYVFTAGSIDGDEKKRNEQQNNNSIDSKKTTTVASEEESAYDFDLITEQQKKYYCNYHNHLVNASSHSSSESTNAERIDSYIQKYQQNKHIMKQRIKQNNSFTKTTNASTDTNPTITTTSSTNTTKKSASVNSCCDTAGVLDSLAYSTSVVDEDEESVDDTSTFDWSFKSSPWTVRCSTGIDSSSSGCERDAEEKKEKTIQGDDDDEESCRSESQTSITKDEKKQNYHSNSNDEDEDEDDEMQEIDLEDGSNEIDNNNDTDSENNKDKESKACCSEMKKHILLLYSYTSPFLFIVFALLLLGTVMYATSQIIIMDSSSPSNHTLNVLDGHNNNQSLVFHVVEKTEMVEIDLTMNMNVTSSPTISPSDGHE